MLPETPPSIPSEHSHRSGSGGSPLLPHPLPVSLPFLFLALLSVISTWPILYYQYLPFMDHPSHLLKYNVLAHFGSTQFGYSEFYRPNLLPAPNLLNDYLTALLAQVFSIDFASRLCIAGAMIALPLALWFYLSKARPGTEGWALLSVPFVWSQFLSFGNENFCLSVPIMLFLLGRIIEKSESTQSTARWVELIALGLMLYFAHFFTFAVAGLAATLHWVVGQRSFRSFVRHMLPFLPGSILYLVWSSLKPTYDNSTIAAPWTFVWREKFHALVQGTCPAPWSSGMVLWSSIILAIVLFMIYRGIKLWAEGDRFPLLLVGSCWLIALCLQRWTIIFIPDQRLWWLSLFLGLSLFPILTRNGLKTAAFTAVPLALGASLAMGAAFQGPNKDLAAIDNAFKQFPKGLRLLYFGDPGLPPHLHRAFEYYHIRRGGFNPMQLIGPDQSVVYTAQEQGPPAQYQQGFTIYDYAAEPWTPYFHQFDGALIIGNPTEPQQKIVAHFEQNQFEKVTDGSLTLMLRKGWQAKGSAD